MAQATVMNSGDTRASVDVPCTAAAPVTIGIFATGGIKPGMRAVVTVTTPGAPNFETELDHIKQQHVMNGDCTARVTRVEGTFGVFTG